MGTIVAVTKGSQIAVATDSCNLRDSAIKTGLNISHGCILRFGESFIGLNSSLSVQQAIEDILLGFSEAPGARLSNRDEIRIFFARLHETLKHRNGIYVNFQQGQEFEWTPMNAIIANASGIYKVDSSRAVYEFTKFWAMGSGEPYALGAMAALYNTPASASEIAQMALEAVKEIELDRDRKPEVFCIESHRVISAPLAIAKTPCPKSAAPKSEQSADSKLVRRLPRSRPPRNRPR